MRIALPIHPLHDSAGRVATFTTADGTSAISYDNDNQIAAVTNASGLSGGVYTTGSIAAQDFTFDVNGNNTGGGLATVSADNQVTNDGVATVNTFDHEGNLATTTHDNGDGTSTRTTYTYDFRNRLTNLVTDTLSSGTVTEVMSISYSYTARNQRQSKSSSVTGLEYYVYDGNNLVPTADGTDIVFRHALMGPGQNQVLAQEDTYDAPAVGYHPTTRWALTDYLGSVRDILSDAGAQIDHITYTAFGERSDTHVDQAIVFGYTGFFHDFDTDMDVSQTRLYRPSTGTWLQQDFIGFAGGLMNLTEYVGNDPMNGRDPRGQKVLDVAAPGFSYVGQSALDLEDTLVDLESRKDYAGRTGGVTNAEWLWDQVVKAKAQLATLPGIGGPIITNQLIEIRNDLRTKWPTFSAKRQCKLISSLTNLWKAGASWEIDMLAARTVALPGTATRSGKETVTVAGKVYNDADVNYWLFGVAMELSGYSEFYMTRMVAEYRFIATGGEWVGSLFGGPGTTGSISGRVAWAESGYRGTFAAAAAAGIDVKTATPATKAWTKSLSGHWGVSGTWYEYNW